MNRILPTLVVLSSVFASVLCEAQTVCWSYRPHVAWCRPVVYGVGPAYSSTPVEGARRGLAAVVFANGMAVRSASRAMINYEEARSKYIDNAAKASQTYWERRRLAESERAKDRAEALEARDRYLAARKPRSPPRLEENQLDPASGELRWPEALMDDEYSKHREKLDELFLLRAQSGTAPGLAREISATSREMECRLKKNIRKLRPNEYLAARKFLDGLAYEGSLSAG